MTSEDHTIERVTPALSRFSATELADKWRDVISTLPQRSQMSLRQLALTLPSLSPLFDASTVDFVRGGLSRVLADHSIVATSDFYVIVNELLIALVPHMNCRVQHDLLQTIPATVMEFVALCDRLDCLPVDEFDSLLALAIHEQLSAKIRRVLLFAPSASCPLSDRSKELIRDCILADDDTIAGLAALIASRRQDDDLRWVPVQKLIDQGTDRQRHSWADARTKQLVAEIAVRQNDPKLLSSVGPEELSWCSKLFGEHGASLYWGWIETAVERLLAPVTTRTPTTAQMAVQLSDAPNRRIFRTLQTPTDDGVSTDADDFFASQSLSEEERINAHLSRREKQWSEVRTFEAGLVAEGASTLTDYVSIDGAGSVVKLFPKRVAALVRRILDVENTSIQRNLFNYAVPLAGALAEYDEELAKAVFERYRQVHPVLNVLTDRNGAPLHYAALFSSPTALLDSVKRTVFDASMSDAALERATWCADQFGAREWLDGYTRELCSANSFERIARGVTIASLREVNDESDLQLTRAFCGDPLQFVCANARDRYERNKWALHWFASSSAAKQPLDFWRFGNLAAKVVDMRYVGWRRLECYVGNSFQADLVSQFESRAKKRTKKREETLFGLPTPSSELKKAFNQAAWGRS
jgi:hypothetical protein